MIKVIEKIKNIFIKDNLYRELRLHESEPSKKFEKDLKVQFLSKALNEDKNDKLKNIFGVTNLYKLFFVLTVVVIIFGGFYRYDFERKNDQELETLYISNSQTALLPFLIGTRLDHQNVPLIFPNSIPIYENIRQDYVKVTTQEFTYGPAFDRCQTYYLSNKNVKKSITYEYYKDRVFKYRTELYDRDDNQIALYIYDGEYLYENIQGEVKKYQVEPVFQNSPELPDINILENIQNKSDKNKVTSLIKSKIKCGQSAEDAISRLEWNKDNHEISKVDIYAGSESEENLVITTETQTQTLLDVDLDLDGLLDIGLGADINLEGILEVDLNLDTGNGLDLDLDLELLNIPLLKLGL